MPCARSIGVPDACIDVFAQMNSSLANYKQAPKELAQHLKDCKKWMAVNYDHKAWKKCLDLEHR